MSRRVLLALSGGVDSSVAVHLLREAGYEVEAAVLDLSPAHSATVEAARETARLLDLPLHVVEKRALFNRNVIDPFVRSYQLGETPNPCIVCNPTTKFAAILETADTLGCPYIATGHYAGVARLLNNRYAIRKAGCLKRDQSYMLYRLPQETLCRLLLPLAALEKNAVRFLAERLALPCAQKPDSQEICFIDRGGYPAYIEKHYGAAPEGEFISPDGAVCGRHKGIIHYTVGQRKGLGVALGRPVFIRAIDPGSNRIYLAESGEAFSDSIRLSDCVWQSVEHPNFPICIQAKIRSQATPADAVASLGSDGQTAIQFNVPQRAPAKGQSCVLYDGDLVVGGGFIVDARNTK